jgi:hypothetical protein
MIAKHRLEDVLRYGDPLARAHLLKTLPTCRDLSERRLDERPAHLHPGVDDQLGGLHVLGN